MDFYVNYNDNDISIDEFLEGVKDGEETNNNYYNVKADYFHPAFCYLKRNNNFHKLKCYKDKDLSAYYDLNTDNTHLDPGVIKGYYPLYCGQIHDSYSYYGNTDSEVYKYLKIENQSLYYYNGTAWMFIRLLPRVVCVELYGGGGAGGNTGKGDAGGNGYYAGGGGAGGFISCYIDTQHTFFFRVGYAGQVDDNKSENGHKGGDTLIATNFSFSSYLGAARGGSGGGGIWYDRGVHGGAGGDGGDTDTDNASSETNKDYITILFQRPGSAGFAGKGRIGTSAGDYFIIPYTPSSYEVQFAEAPEFNTSVYTSRAVNFTDKNPAFPSSVGRITQIGITVGSGGSAFNSRGGQSRIVAKGYYSTTVSTQDSYYINFTPYWTYLWQTTYSETNEDITSHQGCGGAGGFINGVHVSQWNQGYAGAPGAVILKW